MVGVFRQRAAPSSKLVGAAQGPFKQSKVQPRRLSAPDASESEMNENLQSSTMRTTLFQSGPLSKQCGLTIRSTGPIAAYRHLGYKSLAQMPARHNGPVSSNVRRQKINARHSRYVH